MKYINLQICTKCKSKTNTFRHPFAKVWCQKCGYVLREEGDQTIQHKEKAKNNVK